MPRYFSIRYTERLSEAGAVTSVGSRGDAYDNALAETISGLYRTELIRNRGPCKTLVEVAVWLSETPIGPLGYESSGRLTRRLLAGKETSR